MSVQFISGACLMVVSIYISEAISPILIGNHSKLCSFVLLSNSTTSFLFIVYFPCARAACSARNGGFATVQAERPVQGSLVPVERSVVGRRSVF